MIRFYFLSSELRTRLLEILERIPNGAEPGSPLFDLIMVSEPDDPVSSSAVASAADDE